MPETDQRLLDHFMNPRNVGEIDHPDGCGRALNPVNQYLTDIYLRVKDGTILDIKFKTFGCVVTIATASALTTCVKGKSISGLLERPDPVHHLFSLIEHEVGSIPAQNWHCLPTAVQAFLVALSDHYHRIKDETMRKRVEDLLTEVHRFFEKELSTK